MGIRAEQQATSKHHTRRRRYALLTVLAFVTIAAGACQPLPPTDPGSSRIDLKVLVVDDGSPMVGAIRDQLTAEGVPSTVLNLGDPTRPVVTASFLASGSHAFFQAVVLPNERGGTLSPDELSAIEHFERSFDIRQVDAYTYANVNVGLDATSPTFDGDLNGVTATVTDAGKAHGFGYLNGPVPFGVGSYATVARPLGPTALPAGASFTTLVSAPIPADGSTGSILGVYRNGGIDQLVITAAFDATFNQFRALGPGIVDWMTRGVHLGENRNYFTVQVDDVFNSDSLWDSQHHCTPGEDCPRDAQGNSIYPETDARMTADDVNAVVQWQQANAFQLQMVFNAGVAADDDPLTQAFLAAKNDFWWINHTWTHEFLGCQQDFSVIPWVCKTDPNTGQMLWVPESVILDQINQNIAWAEAKGLPFDRTELVSGEYSGLQIPGVQPTDNPNFVDAIGQTGIKWLASDVSRNELAPRQVNGATTVPRYPINIFYNAQTEAQEVSEYNWIYTSQADGGSGYCTAHPDTTTCITPIDPTTGFDDTIVPLETSLRMTDILHNDPRPIMIHATNLTGERIALPAIDAILTAYRALAFPSAPLVSVDLAQAGEIQARQRAWAAEWTPQPGSPSSVEAYLEGGQVHVNGSFTGDVPITVPLGTVVAGTSTPFGDVYGASRSGWTTLPGGTLTLSIPQGTIANPTPPALPSNVAAFPEAPSSVQVSWTPSASDGGRALSYLVVARAPSAAPRVVLTAANEDDTVIAGLQAGMAYTIGVIALSSAGHSAEATAPLPVLVPS